MYYNQRCEDELGVRRDNLTGAFGGYNNTMMEVEEEAEVEEAVAVEVVMSQEQGPGFVEDKNEQYFFGDNRGSLQTGVNKLRKKEPWALDQKQTMKVSNICFGSFQIILPSFRLY